MKTESFKGKDFMTLLDWTKEEVETILDVALDLKQRLALGEYHDHILRTQTLFMIFFIPASKLLRVHRDALKNIMKSVRPLRMLSCGA